MPGIKPLFLLVAIVMLAAACDRKREPAIPQQDIKAFESGISDEVPFIEAIRNNKLDTVKRMLDEGEDAYMEVYGRLYRPIHIAVRTRNTDMVNLLLEYGADVEAQSPSPEVAAQYKLAGKGMTPLLMSVRDGDLNTARALIEHGADVMYEDEPGHTLLYYAIPSLNVDLVRLLLDEGIDPNQAPKIGVSPLLWNSMHGTPEIGDLLISRGAEFRKGESESLSK